MRKNLLFKNAALAASLVAMSFIVFPACNNGGEKKEDNTAVDSSQFKKDQWADTTQNADSNQYKKDQWADSTKADSAKFKKDQWADTTKK